MNRTAIVTPFRKSSYSGGDHSECVEVAGTTTGGRVVRDSKARAHGTAAFSATAWHAFTTRLKTGGAA